MDHVFDGAHATVLKLLCRGIAEYQQPKISLSLRNNNLDDEDVIAVLEARRQAKIRVEDAARRAAAGASYINKNAIFSKLDLTGNLRVGSLINGTMRPPAWRSQLMSDLQRIKLDQCLVTPTWLEVFANAAVEAGHLQELRVRCCQLNKKHVGPLVILMKGCLSLRKLDISRNAFPAKAGTTFAETLQQHALHITRFDISVNKLGLVGVGAFLQFARPGVKVNLIGNAVESGKFRELSAKINEKVSMQEAETNDHVEVLPTLEEILAAHNSSNLYELFGAVTGLPPKAAVFN